MNKNTKKKLIIVIGILCAIACLVLSLLLSGVFKKEPKPYVQTATSEQEAVSKSLELAKSHYEQFYNNSQLSDDYKGILFFEDDWLNLDIVQSFNDIYDGNGEYYNFYSYGDKAVTEDNILTDGCDGRRCNGNDVYIKTDWKTMKHDQWGSNFIDYRNNLSDDNVILYIHHASREYFGDEEAEKIQGTKLDYLLDENNYKDHSTFYLLVDGEIRTYQVASVFKLDNRNEKDMQILYRTNLNNNLYGETDNNKAKVLKHIQSGQLYDTNITLDEDAKYLTISTCIQGQSDRYREIIIGKLIESKPTNEIRTEYLSNLEAVEEVEQELTSTEQIEGKING